MTALQRVTVFLFWPLLVTGALGFVLVAGLALWIAMPFFEMPWETPRRRMSEERWNELADLSSTVELTEQEIEDGWHWCSEFDGLLVGPGMDERNYCKCEETE